MMDHWKERFQLEGILSILAGGMTLASRVNRGFREDVSQHNGVAEIRTEDRSVARRFYISNGTLRAARGPHPSPDYAIVYQDVPVALRILKKGSQEAAFQAISEGKMKFEGDMAFGMWFNELLQKLGVLLKEPGKLLGLS